MERKDINDLAWENRRLCSDGNCIGVIGPDGNCGECGKPSENGETAGGLPGPVENDECHCSDDEIISEDVKNDGADNEIDAGETDPEWENRRLCSDGNCIGVIGPDGNCKECGKPLRD